jgi:hypothetical protein
MTGRFPAPWRILENPNGFAVDEASGRQLGVFSGQADPWGRSEVTASPKDDKRAKLETSLSPQGAPETWHLTRGAQPPKVTSSPSVEAPTTVPDSIPFEPDGWRSTPLLRRPSDPLSNRTKFLIAIAVAALPAGYFIFEDSERAVDVAAAPKATADIPHVEWPLQEAQSHSANATGITVDGGIVPEVQTASLQPTARLDIRPTESGRIEARPPQTLPERGRRSFAASRDASTCFLTASAMRQNRHGRWPSWTLRALGHEGTRCWYAATRTAAHDHRIEIRRPETAQTTEKVDSRLLLFGVQ